jgi:hypothetical protein
MRYRRQQHHGSALAHWLRLCRGRRVEIRLGAALLIVRAISLHLPAPQASVTLLSVAAAAIVLAPPTRAWLFGALDRQRTWRWLAKGAVAVGLEPPAVVAVHPVPAGTLITLAIPKGTTAEDYDNGAEALAVCFSARSVRVARDPANASRMELTVVTHDPLAGPGTRWPGTEFWRSDLWRGLPLGVDESGNDIWIQLAEHHLLVGGEPGAGKSNALSLVVGAAALDPTVELWCLDAKLVELAPWRGLSRAFVGPDIAEATAALGVLQAEMTNRYEWLLRQKLRKVTPETGLGLVVVVIDELALYIQGKGKERDEFALALRDLVARGRAAGIVVVAATQKPAADVVPTALRDLFGYRLALRCSTREASDTVLGSGWSTAGASAADIDPNTRGVGLLLADTGVPRRLRCHQLTDADMETVVDRATLLRPDAGGRT